MEINKPVSTIIIFITTLILFFLFVAPEYQKSSDLQNNLAQKQEEYDVKSVYYAKISETIKSIDSRKDVLKKINSALPSDFFLAPLVYFFQKKGAEAGLIVKSITLSQISPATLKKEVRNITFKINLSGNYQNLKNFLSSLDESERLFEVNSISFKSPVISQDLKQPKNQQQTYNFELEVKTHTY